MSQLFLSRELAASGIEFGEIRQLQRNGELERLRRGAYIEPAALSETERHLLLVKAAMAMSESDSVVSFGSAAVLHQLPVEKDRITRVHLTRKRNSSGRVRRGIHVHVAPLSEADLSQVDGLAVTGLDRTVVDLARTTTLGMAVAAGDAALRRGMDREAARDQLELARRRRGIRTARRAVELIDGRSESVAESLSRVIMSNNDLPLPELQVEITGGGGFAARVDFLWEDAKVVGEFDGYVKYGRLLAPGEQPGDAVFKEKIREDRLRELGYIVVRWVWDDLLHPQRLVARIRRALEVAARAGRR
ncbi:type IV toxin-antitoxin system AbiEi family antitoxin domain-containing protein [Microlunatus sp. Gsoil 973]|uniref:type IV toxin-antitoxin system AbiEi family antitoxin domain-containing protein n=1 Tax=Microlunatus sp. Gsoil 973 TaxID=2672569 RepID=UPI0012B4BF56|nr:type IV toxin-antitoxin system AbiEi family antitoxin domain-containing protein [Microlunatus sp. Gsoil 973]QGN35029.1 hypothetical protein GJV80_21840 [Microlunatus sp. Gsoil 973]